MNKSWTVIVEEDEEGNCVLPFPAEMIEELGWLTGDILDMEVNEETGTITLINISCNERKANVTG
jgi:bifunctional DNA-binding transcriptional regulator/antitoxin component of YhaV-PrlF toxin-antitoxin module